jgi:hypothetical protein
MTTTFQEALEYASRASTEEIEQFYTVLKERSKMARKVQASLNASILKPGDRVRLSDRMTPQYLRNIEVTVVQVTGTKVEIALDEAIGRFHGDGFTVPASAVTKVD